jgi:hypothetical protein
MQKFHYTGYNNKEFKEKDVQPLDRTYPNALERIVKEARDVAKTAALTILEQLGVGTPLCQLYAAADLPTQLSGL